MQKYTGFSVINGVEDRVMVAPGDVVNPEQMRPVVILFKRMNEVVKGNFTLNIDNVGIAVIDHESYPKPELIPGITKLDLEPTNLMGGHLQRMTSDEIHTDPDKPFSRGYVRVLTNSPDREVREAFFILDVLTLSPEEFDKQVAEAVANFSIQEIPVRQFSPVGVRYA